MSDEKNNPNCIKIMDLNENCQRHKRKHNKKRWEAPYMRYIGCRGWRMVPHPLSERYHKSAIHQCRRARGTNFWEG